MVYAVCTVWIICSVRRDKKKVVVVFGIDFFFLRQEKFYVRSVVHNLIEFLCFWIRILKKTVRAPSDEVAYQMIP